MNLKKALLIGGLFLAAASFSSSSAHARGARVGVEVGVPVHSSYPYNYPGYYNPNPYQVYVTRPPSYYYYPQPAPAAQQYYSNYPPSTPAPTPATPLPATPPPPVTPTPETILSPSNQPSGTEL